MEKRMDVVDQERAGWMNEPDLIEEIMEEAGRLASDSERRMSYVPEAAPHTVITATSQAKVGAAAAVIVLRKRGLITEQGLQLLKLHESRGPSKP